MTKKYTATQLAKNKPARKRYIRIMRQQLYTTRKG
jgi:uncharacterized protein YneF (UPF0154 family)